MSESFYKGEVTLVKGLPDKKMRLVLCGIAQLSRMHAQIIANSEDEILLEGKVIDFPDSIYQSVLYPESSKCEFTPLDVKIEGLQLSSYFFRINNPSRARECWADTGIVTVFEPVLKDIVLFNPYWAVLFNDDVQCSDISLMIGGNDKLLRAKVASARLQGYLPDERHIDCQIKNGELLGYGENLPEYSQYVPRP